MPGSIQGKTQTWFTVNERLSEAVTANTDIDVESITAVAFDADVSITFGALAVGFALKAGVPIGIDTSISSISVDVNAFMFAMGGR